MPSRPASRLTLPLLLAAGSALLPTLGCLPAPVAAPAHRAGPARPIARTVRVVASPQAGEAPPRVEGRIGKASSTAKGALAGAGSGAMAGLEATLRSGSLAPFLAPILIPLGAVAGAAGGGAAGYADAIPKDQARALQEALDRGRLDLCRELAARVGQRLPAYGKAAPGAGEGEDLRLEVSVDQWGMFGGSGSDPMGELEAAFSFQVWTPGDAQVLSRRFVLGGARRPFSEWVRGGDALQEAALGLLLEAGAETLLDAAFLTREEDRGRGLAPGYCGLAHLEPPMVLMPAAPFHLGPPRAGSVTPLLAWQAFLPAGPDEGDASSPSDIRYDLRIWRSIGGGPGELVYEREGLALEPRHTEEPPQEVQPWASVLRVVHQVEAPLAKDTDYLWSVRARYRVEGVPAATRWSMNREPEFHARSGSGRWLGSGASRATCGEDGIPPLHHHRFRTP